MDLHWDSDRILFSMPNDKGLWQVWEMAANGQRLRQVTPGDQPLPAGVNGAVNWTLRWPAQL